MRSLIVFLLTLLVAVTGAAQVVQPSYVRQSKSAQIQVFTAAQTSTAIDTTFTSSVIETTSFNGAQVSIDFDMSCNGDIFVLSSLTKDGTFVWAGAQSPNSSRSLDSILASPAIYNVSNFGPYIKFRFVVMGGCPNGLNLSTTLVPFPSNVTVQGDVSNPSFPVEIGGKYGTAPTDSIIPITATSYNALYVKDAAYPFNLGSSPYVVSNLSTTTVFTNSTGESLSISIQNQGTVPVRCGTDGSVTAASYEFSLKAGAVAGDGSGGSQQFVLAKDKSIQCIAIGGAGSVSALEY